MIVANVRQHLTRDDAQLALQVVGEGSESEYRRAETMLREQGIDVLLDDPRLLTGLLVQRRGVQASYALFVYVIVRHALLALQMQDRAIADYVASILMHFGMRDRAHRIADHDDQLYTTLTDVAGDIEHGDARRGFLARVHLGNYALWLSGLFPDYIAYRRARSGGPDLDYYDDMGRKGFVLAAEHRLAQAYGVVPLFETVAEQFPQLRMALNTVSDTLFFPDRSSPDRLLRQVSNEARWRRWQ